MIHMDKKTQSHEIYLKQSTVCCYLIVSHIKKDGVLCFAAFVQVCYIGDASRGSLSSYGYILMMLHYLQQCKPPVIPVLQEVSVFFLFFSRVLKMLPSLSLFSGPLRESESVVNQRQPGEELWKRK